MRSARPLVALSTAILVSVVTGCGGGGGGGGGGAANNNVVSGRGFDGPIRNGTGVITSLATPPLASPVTFTTDTNGQFSILLPPQLTGPCRARITGGQYTCAASGVVVTITPAAPLEAIFNGPGPVTVNVTPLTTLASQLAPMSITSGAVTQLNTVFSSYFGFGSTDITQLVPLDLSNPTDAAVANLSPADPRVRQALVLAAFAQVATNLGTNVPAMLSGLSQDASDGVFDGRKNGVSIAGIPPTAMTSSLAAAMTQFLAGAFAATSATFSADVRVTSYIQSIASSSGQIPGLVQPAGAPPSASSVSIPAGPSNPAGFVNPSNASALTVAVAVPAGAQVGDVVSVLVEDATGAASGTATLLVAGQQTVTLGVNALPLADGALRLVAWLTRAGVSSLQTTGTGTKETALPVVTLTAPTAGAFAGPNGLTLTASATPTISAIVSVSFSVQQGPASFGIATYTALPYQTVFVPGSIPALTDGPATIRASALDAAGNMSTTAVGIVVDETAPVISGASVPSGTAVRSLSSITFFLSDGAGSGVNTAGTTVSVQVNGTLLGSGQYSLNTSVANQVTVSIPGSVDGNYAYTVSPVDNVGNRRITGSWLVVQDSTAPVNPTFMVSPLAPNNFASGTLTLQATATEDTTVSAVTFFVQQNGATTTVATVTASPYTTQLNTMSLSNTTANLYAVLADAAGNTTQTATVAVFVDNTAPSIMITAPSNGAFVRGTFAINVSASDGDGGMNRVDYHLGTSSGALITTSVTPPFGAWIDSTNARNFMSGVPATVVAVAFDNAGNSAAASVAVTPDNIAPTAGPSAPSSGAAVQSLTGVTVSAQDPGQNPSGLNFAATTVSITRDTGSGPAQLVQGTDFTRVNNGGPASGSISIGFYTPQNAAYLVSVTPQDNAGNTGTQVQIALRSDNVPPTITALNVPPGPVQGPQQISAAANDGNQVWQSGMASVTFVFQTAQSTTSVAVLGAGPSFQTTFDFNTLIPLGQAGTITVTAVAADAAGNTSATVSRTTFVDHTPPGLFNVMWPFQSNQFIRAQNSVTASASDDVGLAAIQVTIDGTVAGSVTVNGMSANNVQVVFDTRSFSDGPHTVLVQSVDTAGNTSWTALPVGGLANAAPAFTGSTPVNGALLGLAQGMQLSPAMFTYTTVAGLDLSSVSMTSIAVSFNGTVLGTNQFFVNASPNVVQVSLNQQMLPTPSANGDTITFTLSTGIHDRAVSNVSSSFNFAQNPTTIAVTYDSTAPQLLWQQSLNGLNAAIIAQWNETISSTSTATVVFRQHGTSTNVPAQFVQQFTQNQTNDSYAFVPAQLLTPGVQYDISTQGFTDLAGNLAFSISQSITITSNPSSFFVSRVDFLVSGTATLVASVTTTPTQQGFVMPTAVVNQNQDVRMVFNQPISPTGTGGSLRPSLSAGNNNSITPTPTAEATGAFGSSTDAIRYRPSAQNPAFAWLSKTVYRISANAQTPQPPTGTGNFSSFTNAQFTMVVPGPNTDVTPPSVVALAGGRDSGSQQPPFGTIPSYRPFEPLRVGFSEPVDPTRVVSQNFTISSGPAGQTTTFTASLEDFNANVVNLRPMASLGQGTYTLLVQNVQDVATKQGVFTPNVMTPTSIQFVIASASTTPAILLTQPMNGDTLVPSVQPTITFNDRMDPTSFTDLGGSPTFKLEVQLGQTFIPVHGLSPNPSFSSNGSPTGAPLAAQVIGLNFGNGPSQNMVFYGGDGRTYRFTLSPNGGAAVRDVDGASLTGGQTQLTFTEAQVGMMGPNPPTPSAQRPQIQQTRLRFQQIRVVLLGQIQPSALSSEVQFQDPVQGDQFNLTLSRFDAPQAATSTMSTGMGSFGDMTVNVPGAMVGPVTTPTAGIFLVEGQDNRLETTLTDNEGSVLRLDSLYGMRNATLDAAAPTVTTPNASFPGVHAFQGTISNAQDGSHIRTMAIVVLYVDQTQNLQIAYFGFCQMTRTNGTITYSHTMSPDMALPPLPPPLSYVAGVLVQTEQTISDGFGGDSFGVSAASSPFNP